MTHTVKKPFHAKEVGRIVQVGEVLVPTDEHRARALIRGGLIVEGVPEPVVETDKKKGVPPPPPPPKG